MFVPIETYTTGPVPQMLSQIKRIQLAEQLGFSAVWLRDVPFNVPSFGDAGQLYDPFVYLGLLAGKTQRIALGVSSIILPLRHPAHVAKAASSIDVLSNGRLLLGVASGDSPQEYPALNQDFQNRGERFRGAFEYIHQVVKKQAEFTNAYGNLAGGIDLLPKPVSGKLPLLITGRAQQNPNWLARSGNGWMLYPRHQDLQAKIIDEWRNTMKAMGRQNQPVMEPLYVDLVEDPNKKAQPIHLGFRLGINALVSYLKERKAIGINHVALNLHFNQAYIETTLHRLAKIDLALI